MNNLFTRHFYGDESLRRNTQIGRNEHVRTGARALEWRWNRKHISHAKYIILDMLIRFMENDRLDAPCLNWSANVNVWMQRLCKDTYTQTHTHTFAFKWHLHALQCDHCCNAYTYIGLDDISWIIVSHDNSRILQTSIISCISNATNIWSRRHHSTIEKFSRKSKFPEQVHLARSLC